MWSTASECAAQIVQAPAATTAVSLEGMTSLAHIRTAAKRLAEVEQGAHFGMESWSVAGRGFLTVTKDRAAVQLRLPPDDAQRVLTDIPGNSLLTRGETVLGVTIPLDALNGMQANAVIGRSWATGLRSASRG